MSRKQFRNAFLTAALVLGCACFAFAADQTWTGKISDSKCGAKHNTSAEHGSKMTDAECVAGCIKGGAKYVFVTGGKVYTIDNQDFGDLSANAGETVKVTGTRSGSAITVSKIEH